MLHGFIIAKYQRSLLDDRGNVICNGLTFFSFHSWERKNVYRCSISCAYYAHPTIRISFVHGCAFSKYHESMNRKKSRSNRVGIRMSVCVCCVSTITVINGLLLLPWPRVTQLHRNRRRTLPQRKLFASSTVNLRIMFGCSRGWTMNGENECNSSRPLVPPALLRGTDCAGSGTRPLSY